jgi:hypothetical protein
MLRKTSIAVAAACIGLAGSASAQTFGTPLTPNPTQPASRVGTRGANFLEIGVGARAQALGGAFTGLASGGTAMYWNNAGLGTVSGFTALFSRSDLYADLGISHTFAGVVLPLLGGGLGVSYNRLDSGDIPRTNEENPDGGDVQFGNTFTWQGTAVGVHYGRRLTDRLAVGVAGKTISEGMNGASANWWGVDIGTQFSSGLYGISFAAALSNIGPAARMEGSLITTRVTADEAFQVNLPLRFATRPAQLPTMFRFSVVQELAGGADALMAPGGAHNLRLALELSDAVDTDLQTALGAEYHFRRTLFLRAGKRWANEDATDFRPGSYGWSFGGGVRLAFLGRGFMFDYAYTSMGDLDNVQVFSFEIGN